MNQSLLQVLKSIESELYKHAFRLGKYDDVEATVIKLDLIHIANNIKKEVEKNESNTGTV